MQRITVIFILYLSLLLASPVEADILYICPDSQKTADALARSWRGTQLPWSRLSKFERGPLAAISYRKPVSISTRVDPYPWYGQTVRVEFAYDSYAIRPEVARQLEEIGWVLISPAIRDRIVVIEGHTDSDGTETYNERLSFQRAQAVKNYLVKHFHISSGRIRILGFGENDPLLPNTTPLNKQTNRRAAIQVPVLKMTCGGL